MERTVAPVERRWALALVLVAVVIAGLLAFAPLGSGTACSSTGAGAMRCTTDSRSLLDSEGSSVLLVLTVPVVLALVFAAVPSRRLRMVVAGLLTTLMVLGIMTIGLFIAPIVALAWVVAARTPGPRPSG
jgi:hypothetical protein